MTNDDPRRATNTRCFEHVERQTEMNATTRQRQRQEAIVHLNTNSPGGYSVVFRWSRRRSSKSDMSSPSSSSAATLPASSGSYSLSSIAVDNGANVVAVAAAAVVLILVAVAVAVVPRIDVAAGGVGGSDRAVVDSLSLAAIAPPPPAVAVAAFESSLLLLLLLLFPPLPLASSPVTAVAGDWTWPCGNTSGLDPDGRLQVHKNIHAEEKCGDPDRNTRATG